MVSDPILIGMANACVFVVGAIAAKKIFLGVPNLKQIRRSKVAVGRKPQRRPSVKNGRCRRG